MELGMLNGVRIREVPLYIHYDRYQRREECRDASYKYAVGQSGCKLSYLTGNCIVYYLLYGTVTCMTCKFDITCKMVVCWRGGWFNRRYTKQ